MKISELLKQYKEQQKQKEGSAYGPLYVLHTLKLFFKVVLSKTFAKIFFFYETRIIS